jgi:RNA-directed DNA polymerase
VYRDDVLAHAYALSRSHGGAPGVDGQTFEDIESYGVERWLGERREELREGRYEPRPVRRVMIPKAGGAGERPLGIPTIRDRVIQTAVKLVIEPIFEADFDEAAYGYRPGRSAVQAVQSVHVALRRGHTNVVDADLSQYFDMIPHAELMKCLARRISDGKVLSLLKAWLKVPVEEKDDRGNRRTMGGKKARRGTPQGGVISPLLANVYMHRFIRAFRKYKMGERFGAVLVNYADDFVVLCRRDAAAVLEITRQWMSRIGLSLNEKKTCLREAREESFQFLGYTFGPEYSPRTGDRYLGASPSKKATDRLKDRLRALLSRGNKAPIEEVVASVNRIVRGWANYFCYGTLRKTRARVDKFIEAAVGRFLRQRHKVTTRGTRWYPASRIFGELGVISMQTLPRLPIANAST